ncbi:Fic family protein [Prevotella pectinovora]
MIGKEWVTMTLPDKPKSKFQRYVITGKGKKEI